MHTHTHTHTFSLEYESIRSWRKPAVLILLIAAAWVSADAQYLVNKVWEKSYGLPTGFDWSHSVFDATGNVLITGNTVNPTEQANFLTAKITPSGNIDWQRQINHPGNNNEYGISIAAANGGNVVVVGTSHTSPTNGYDFMVAKYSSAGTLLWTSLLNGISSGDDFPVSLKVDPSGNVFVTGKSMGAGTGFDYFTAKYNSSGTLQWSKRYDFSGQDDTPTALEISPTSGHIVVTGASLNASGQVEYATLAYNPVNGNILQSHRYTDFTHQLLAPTGIKMDSNGEAYIFGQASIDGVNWDILTMNYNPGLNLDWVQYFDGSGRSDGAHDLAIDDDDNVYVTGYVGNPQGGKEFVTIKYDKKGGLQWVSRHMGIDEAHDAISYRLAVNNDHFVFVTGESSTPAGSETVTLMYAPDGEKKWVKNYTHATHLNHKPSAILTDGAGAVYITLQSTDGIQREYTTVKYFYWEPPQVMDTDSGGNPTNIANEIIVRFDAAAVQISTVDNIDIQFGDYTDFLTPAAITAIETKLGISTSGLKVRRIFQRLTTQITNSTTRRGEVIPMPDFWAGLLLQLPTGMNEQAACDSLGELSPMVKYAHLNHVYRLQDVPNDPLYLDQISLDAAVGINAEPAWDLETGESNVKVGVYDSGIDWRHEDFGDGTWAGCKIEGGYSWYHNQFPQAMTTPDSYGHGTSCAGIIGALRDNSLGIAGISGGDGSSGSTGCELFMMGISNSRTAFVSSNLIADAIEEGATWTPTYGYGLHVMNNSWGGGALNGLMQDAIYFAFQNEAVFVAAKGNDGVSSTHYPSDFNDDWVLAVGASDETGHYHDGSGLDDWWSSNWGGTVDFIAPGVTPIIQTVDAGTANGYHSFNGTSAAAPHVAGTAALLLSYFNDPGVAGESLAPEDVEEVLQRSATDCDWTSHNETVGYDDRSGWGRINANAALQMIQRPVFDMEHFSYQDAGATSFVSSTLATNATLVIPFSAGGLPSGTYIGDIWRITATIPHTIAPGKTILASWERNSSSNLLSGATALSPYSDVTLQSVSPTQVVMEGYVYHIKFTQLGSNVNVWYPFSTAAATTNTRLAYTLYTQDNSLGMEDNISENYPWLEVFPCPAQTDATIQWNLVRRSEVSLSVTDMTGRVVVHKEFGKQATGIHAFPLPLENLASGVYFVTLRVGNELLTRKLAKS